MLRDNAGPTCALSLQWVKASVAQRCSSLADAHLGETGGCLIPQKGSVPCSRRTRSRDNCALWSTLPTRHDLKTVVVEIAATGVANILPREDVGIKRMQLQKSADVPGEVDLADLRDIA